MRYVVKAAKGHAGWTVPKVLCTGHLLGAAAGSVGSDIAVIVR